MQRKEKRKPKLDNDCNLSCKFCLPPKGPGKFLWKITRSHRKISWRSEAHWKSYRAVFLLKTESPQWVGIRGLVGLTGPWHSKVKPADTLCSFLRKPFPPSVHLTTHCNAERHTLPGWPGQTLKVLRKS